VEPIAGNAKNYRNTAGDSPFRKWVTRKLDGEMHNRVNVRIRRIEQFGNYGDCEPVEIILLLGGNKSTQGFGYRES
jgi:putative component of toxin-antitoxin plasmid stabilization module